MLSCLPARAERLFLLQPALELRELAAPPRARLHLGVQRCRQADHVAVDRRAGLLDGPEQSDLGLDLSTQRYRWHLEKNATQMPAISWRLTRLKLRGCLPVGTCAFGPDSSPLGSTS